MKQFSRSRVHFGRLDYQNIKNSTNLKKLKSSDTNKILRYIRKAKKHPFHERNEQPIISNIKKKKEKFEEEAKQDRKQENKSKNLEGGNKKRRKKRERRRKKTEQIRHASFMTKCWGIPFESVVSLVKSVTHKQAYVTT